jgi:hypothetical protein
MVRVRRIAAIAVLGVIAATYGAASPAQSAEVVKTERFAGLADSAGLVLDVAGTSLTLGKATANVSGTLDGVNKTLAAAGKGVGQLLTASEVETKVPTVAGLLNDAKPQACVANIPIAAILNVSLACGISASSISNDLPISSAAGHVADIRVPGNGPLGQLLNALNIDDLAGTLNGLVGGSSVASAQATDTNLLNGLLGDLGALPVLGSNIGPVNGVLDQLLGLLDGGLGLSELVPDPVVIGVGTSTSFVKTDLAKVTSDSQSAGLDVKLLPVPRIPALANGLIHLVVGEAHTVATYDRTTGKADANPVTANLLRLDVLGVSVPVAPNLDLDIPGLIRIQLGHGTKVVEADRARATAVGASINVLDGLVRLALADAQSEAGGAFKETPKVLAVEAVRQLPRTGGPGPLLPLIGAGMLVLVVVGRRVVIRTR